ncbi:hypothetical protein J6590_029034 [Homalodisca vitripennis]|nr:hypothetical protein J6590_029034 [Homalodisca vitripennis]
MTLLPKEEPTLIKATLISTKVSLHRSPRKSEQASSSSSSALQTINHRIIHILMIIKTSFNRIIHLFHKRNPQKRSLK